MPGRWRSIRRQIDIDLGIRDSASSVPKAPKKPRNRKQPRADNTALRLSDSHRTNAHAYSTSAHLHRRLCNACAKGCVDDVRMLLMQPGSDVNRPVRGRKASGRTTPLMLAAQAGHANVVAVLLHGGVQGIDNGGWPALHRAAAGGHAICVRLLLAAGSNANHLAPSGAGTGFMHGHCKDQPLAQRMIDLSSTASRLARRGTVQVRRERGRLFSRALADAGIGNVVARGSTAQGVHGSTALMWACKAANPSCVELLLASHADCNASDHYMNTALMACFRRKWTLEDEFSPDAGMDAGNACARLLLRAGTDVELKDLGGSTALAKLCDDSWRGDRCPLTGACLLLTAGASTDDALRRRERRLMSQASREAQGLWNHLDTCLKGTPFISPGGWDTDTHLSPAKDQLVAPNVALELLRHGASVRAGKPSALELATARRDAGGRILGSTEALMLLAASWSPASHHTFPEEVRERIPFLLWVGKILDARHAGGMLDVWVMSVLRVALIR